MGVGTIVGSAVFNILCIIGVCGIFAGQVCELEKAAAAASFCSFIDCRAAHVWQKFFAEGKRSHLLQLVFSEVVGVEMEKIVEQVKFTT